MVSKEECEMEGGEWVASYRKSDGTIVKPFCRNLGKGKNPKVAEWERDDLASHKTQEYRLHGMDMEGVINKNINSKKVDWYISVNGKRISWGTSDNVRDAAYEAEREMRRRMSAFGVPELMGIQRKKGRR